LMMSPTRSWVDIWVKSFYRLTTDCLIDSTGSLSSRMNVLLAFRFRFGRHVIIPSLLLIIARPGAYVDSAWPRIKFFFSLSLFIAAGKSIWHWLRSCFWVCGIHIFLFYLFLVKFFFLLLIYLICIVNAFCIFRFPQRLFKLLHNLRQA